MKRLKFYVYHNKYVNAKLKHWIVETFFYNRIDKKQCFLNYNFF